MTGVPPKVRTTNVSSVVVITGEDPYLIGNESQRLLETLLTPDEREMGLSELRADTAEIADVLDELRTVPFLASQRVVLIKDAEPFIKANADKLDAYLDNPSPTGTLLMTAASWDKRTRLHKKLQKHNGVIEVGKLYDNQLPAYVSSYAVQTHHLRLDHQSCQLFIELVGDDPGRLCREIDKLAVYIAPKTSATTADIEALIGHNRMFDAFGVIDAVSKGHSGEAMTRLRSMFEANNDAEYTVVGAFGFHFRRLFRAKCEVQKGSSALQAALKQGIRRKEWQNDFITQLNRLSLPQLGCILAELGRIDFGMKTGKSTAPVAMERLLFQIFSMQRSTS